MLFALSVDLPVDELETVTGVGDLLAQGGGELGEQIAVLAGSGFGIEMQLRYFAREQGTALRIEIRNIALGVSDLPGDAEQFRCRSFAVDGGVDLAVVVKQTLEYVGIAASIGLVGAGHQ
jgi:hypothetical protein